MPNSVHARKTLMAISPLFATKMLLIGLEDRTAEVLNESLEVIKTEDHVLKEDLKEGSNILILDRGAYHVCLWVLV